MNIYGRICGYVNITGSESIPLLIPGHDRIVREIIEPGAFQYSLEKGGNVTLTLDHGERAFADLKSKTLTLREDSHGLYADAMVSDPFIIELAKGKNFKGWSLKFLAWDFDYTTDRETFAETRHVRTLYLQHITLLTKTPPAYPAAAVWRYEPGPSTASTSERNVDIRDLQFKQEELTRLQAESKIMLEKFTR